MSTTDVTGIRSGGRVETERKDKSTDTSSSPVDNASHVVSDAVDMRKVNEIRDAISNGSYTIDAQKIAESLLALERELA